MASFSTSARVLPVLSLHPKRNLSIITSSPSSVHFSNTHLHSLKIRHKSLGLSSFEPGGFVVCSASNNYFSVDEQMKEKQSSEEPYEVKNSMWNWRGYSIRYQYSGSTGPALVLVHGFGANSDHWRKNIMVLAKSHRVYSIDLIGYGYSDKPNPRDFFDKPFYTFETWASQLNDFCKDVVKDQAFFICNSIGGLVGLQAAVMEPEICRGMILLNISLRMLHIKKQPWYGRPLIRSFQNLLRNTAAGKLFYKMVATSESVRNILCQVLHVNISFAIRLLGTI
ncbi:alpha/beta-Hydrolases superfamily protein [Citrus sinensis]|uniref:AB hydrolase-1 domain-containing protein n=2 Tax=Citrus TaxID=2706 RepID=V4U9G2_CITCL|nr:hypothetical protein CICLE_v10015550mg [Citrus x clementina]KAH9740615.1 alpha/beta-Hydrolases superfamily protein [Citrus sinensis]ESR58855.1 hypothetical protein CICLE_v10015550mg [Citrus x clementina]ESR58861.1 hypothetical protein CICLE_v10015550mg [Citrus x clementina]ESR58864.1 hypothetical protein CICLE_v10015550mg [Citrus x clementina]